MAADTGMALGRRLAAVVAAFVVAALAVLVPSGATSDAQTAAGAVFVVDSLSSGGRSATYVSIQSRMGMASVRINVPAGYGVDVTRPVGTQLGYVFANLSDASGSLDGFVSSEIRVDDPTKYKTDVAAQRCAPGTHAAVWRTELAVLGKTIGLPIFVDPAPTGSTDASAVLRLCPVWPDAIPGGLTSPLLSFYVENQIATPTAPGRYTWSALVEPMHPGTSTGYPAGTFELRAVIQQPSAITLNARHDAKAKSVVLSGRVTAVGAPVAGIEVQLTASEQFSDDFVSLGPVTTDAAGQFSVRRRIEKTTRFQASAEDQSLECSSPSTAPGGCLVETVTPPLPAVITVKVRGARDAKLVPRGRDRALARRASLTLEDFPPGWEAVSDSFAVFPCPGFRPDLSKLTIHAEVDSQLFFSETAGAWSTTSVYTSPAQARTALDRVANLAAARCVASELRNDGTNVSGVAPVSFSGVGSRLRAFRLAVSDSEASGYIDLVWIRHGRTLVHVGFAVVNELAIERDVLAALAARARSG